MMRIKIINLMCVLIYTSHQSGTVNSISLVSGPEDAQVVIGTEVILKCEVRHIDKNSTAISWWKIEGSNVMAICDSERVSIVPDSGNLNIANVQPSDSGVYQCLYLSGTEYKHFDPIAKATLNVQQPPSINCSLIRDDIQNLSKTQFFYVGESIRFHCSSTGNGSTPPNLNITKSDVDVPEYETDNDFDQKQVESDELIEKNDTEFRCYLESEALTKPRVCEIKLIALFPLVEIEPKATTVLESTNVSFQCSGSSFKTDDLYYEWQILPYVPGEVVNYTSSILEITNLCKNTNRFDKFTVTCVVKEGQMDWNSSSSLSLTSAPPNQSNNEEGISIIFPLIIAPIAAVAVLSAVFLLFYCRKKRKHTQHNSISPIYETTVNPTESTGQNLHERESEDTIYLEPIVMPSDSVTLCQNQEDNIDKESSSHYDSPNIGSSQAIVYTDHTYVNTEQSVGRQNGR